MLGIFQSVVLWSQTGHAVPWPTTRHRIQCDVLIASSCLFADLVSTSLINFSMKLGVVPTGTACAIPSLHSSAAFRQNFGRLSLPSMVLLCTKHVKHSQVFRAFVRYEQYCTYAMKEPVWNNHCRFICASG